VDTDHGTRDLRMYCAGSHIVKQIVKDLRETVQVGVHASHPCTALKPNVSSRS
jgi:hypothetical protein